MKYCTDCKHFAARHGWYPFDMCRHPAARDVIGRYQTAACARLGPGPCGESGILWEQKPEPAPEPPRVSLWQRLRVVFSANDAR